MQHRLMQCLAIGWALRSLIIGTQSASAQDGADPTPSSLTFRVKRCAPAGPSSEYYQVIADFGDLQPPIVQIRSAASDHGHALSMRERAEKIRARLDQLQRSNSHWCQHLVVERHNGETVVAVKGVPEVPYVITVQQQDLLSMNCTDTAELAQKYITMLRKALAVPTQSGTQR